MKSFATAALALSLSSAVLQVSAETSSTFSAPKPMEQSITTPLTIESTLTKLPTSITDSVTLLTGSATTTSGTASPTSTKSSAATGSTTSHASSQSGSASTQAASASQTPGNGASDLVAPGGSLMLAGLAMGVAFIN